MRRRWVDPLAQPAKVNRCKKCHLAADLRTPLMGKVLVKPPRAHHCRICRECTARMDHHCFFVNQCVGAANYHSFIVFAASILLLLTLTASQTLLTFDRLTNVAAAVDRWMVSAFLYILAWFFLGTFALFLGLLFIFCVRHVQLLARGTTSVEDAYPADHALPSFGVFHNFKSSMGPFWCLLLWNHCDKWEGFVWTPPGSEAEQVPLLESEGHPPVGRKRGKDLNGLILSLSL